MKYRRALSALTLLAFMGAILALPMQQAYAQNDWRANGRTYVNDYASQSFNYHEGSPIGNALKRWLPGILGAVAGGFLGSHFGGTIGMIIGGAAGFFIAKWIVNKFFPDESRHFSYNNWSRDYHRGGWNARARGPWGSVTGSGNGDLATLRQRYFDSIRDYQDALRNGGDASQIRAEFEHNRQAYFNAVGGQ